MTKKTGIVNTALAAAVAALGHGDLVAIVDRGMPLPPGAHIVDLALVSGVPRFAQVVDALLHEVAVEGSVAATEAGPDVTGWLSGLGLAPEQVAHEQLKRMLADTRLIVRTGEATPYANVVLRCGVPF